MIQAISNLILGTKGVLHGNLAITATGVATSATTTGDVTFTVTPKTDGTTELKWVITNDDVARNHGGVSA